MTKFRRLKRLGRICAYGLLLLAIAAIGAAWWAHQHLPRLIAASVSRAYPGLTFSAKSASLGASGELELKEVRLGLKENGKDGLKVESAKIRSGWRELREHFIREIVIERPGVRVTDQLLAAVAAPSGTAKGAADGIPWRVGRLSIVDGSAQIAIAGAPSAQFSFDLNVTEGTRAVPSEGELRLRSMRARIGDEKMPALVIAGMTLRFSPEELRQSKIREITVEAPRVVVTDALVALIPKKSGGGGAAWSVGRLEVERGKARIDIAAAPVAEFDFSAHLPERSSGGESSITLDLANLSVRLRKDGSEALSVPKARAAASLEGLQKREIGEITIADPQAKVSDGLLEAIPAASAESAAPGQEASAPWSIRRLSVKGGQAQVDLSGAPLAKFGFATELADATFSPDGPGELQSLELSDIELRTRNKAVEPFLRIPAIHAEARIPELLRSGRIARIRIEHLDFRYNASFREMIALGERPAVATQKSKASAADEASPVTIGELRLIDGRMHLDDLGLGVPPVECRLDTAFRELALSGDGGAAGHELQTIELSQIALSSPMDPFFTVLKLDTVFVRFTLAGLWRREIAEVSILEPVLAIGPDLFWYVDRVQDNASAASGGAPGSAQESGPEWSIREFSAKSGQLVLALEGQQKLALPMPFESRAQNINFRRLSDLRLKLKIDMPEQDYSYPDYGLTLRGVRGKVEFSLPPRERANNVVNTLLLREVRWKNFRGRNFFLDVTYDAKGIYGKMGGRAHDGLVNGQFNFLIADDSPWNGWVSGTHVDLKQVTDALAPQKFSLTGPADFRLSVGAVGKEIESMVGDFVATRKGDMRIGKLDDILRTLPGDWTGLKRGLARISLETLRDFAYETARGDFRFHGRAGALHLDLHGPNGARKITVQVHDEPPTVADRQTITKVP